MRALTVALVALVFVFLYAPIVLLVVYSFNASRTVSIWTGFSTRWYDALWRDAEILDAALLSLQIGALSATFATVLGALLGLALARFGAFRGRAIVAVLASAPLVMPDIIVGLSLLLLFVSMENLIGWPAGRGFATILIAHTTFSLAFVAVVVQSRLAGADRTLEDAAADLGARPWQSFAYVTLPLIAPALVSGWLLAFTLSLDDLVITSFVSGPTANTLPLVVFSRVRVGVTPEVNAVAALLIAAIAVAALCYLYVLLRRPHAPQTER